MLLERALECATEQRAEFLDQACAGRPELRARVGCLLRLAEAGEGFLDRAPLRTASAEGTDDSVHAAGQTVGAYRLLRRLGRGGMAEVWLAERSEGGFQQQAALKLIPHARGSLSQRFATEREILAALVHPGIARLYDGGVEADGTAYMVMEYVEGEHLIVRANTHRLSLSDRLNLFLQIADAVAYAHTRLVVHRDLKPSNILVTSEGQAKLLDFGIAKLLDADAGPEHTRTVYLSPSHAAPEQLTGGVISTATDVYALGVILFELLANRLPWSEGTAPMATAVKRLLDAPIPLPSKLASSDSLVSRRVLRGDLDAIVGKALRKEASDRYPDARAIADDIRRYLDHRPVQARSGARVYVARRFVRRNWLPLASVALLFVAMAAATVAIAWQASKAHVQAQRAESVKNFLVGVFKASDPRIASDKPRGSVTARELLDAAAVRIEKELVGQPQLQVELLGIAATIFCELDESEQCKSLYGRYLEAARNVYGESSQVVIDGTIYKAKMIISRHGSDEGEALPLLDQADRLIHRANLDATSTRADWYVTKARSMIGGSDDYKPLLLRAVDLYESSGRSNVSHVNALTFLGNAYAVDSGTLDAAREFYLRAKTAADKLPERDDAEMALIEFNLANISLKLGDVADSAMHSERAADLYLKTFGERDNWYWITLAQWGYTLCTAGNPVGARPIFDRLMEVLPKAPYEQNRNNSNGVARSEASYGSCLLEEGRPQDAISPLEVAERLYTREGIQVYGYELVDTRIALGLAYARDGRIEDARRTLKAALDEELSRDSSTVSADRPRLLKARESWARFLATQGELNESEEQFGKVVSLDQGRHLLETVQAYAGLAVVALGRGDASAALTASTRSLEVFERVTRNRNARIAPRLWRIHSQALMRSGDLVAARNYAQRALDAFEQYDDPGSPEIEESKTVLGEIVRMAKE